MTKEPISDEMKEYLRHLSHRLAKVAKVARADSFDIDQDWRVYAKAFDKYLREMAESGDLVLPVKPTCKYCGHPITRPWGTCTAAHPDTPGPCMPAPPVPEADVAAVLRLSQVVNTACEERDALRDKLQNLRVGTDEVIASLLRQSNLHRDERDEARAESVKLIRESDEYRNGRDSAIAERNAARESLNKAHAVIATTRDTFDHLTAERDEARKALALERTRLDETHRSLDKARGVLVEERKGRSTERDEARAGDLVLRKLLEESRGYANIDRMKLGEALTQLSAIRKALD